MLRYQQRQNKREHAVYYLMEKVETEADIEKDAVASSISASDFITYFKN